ncbi:MAG: HAD-IIIA family hydrolase [Bacilli bacterium]|nr:HAD-IIIA family hydrolase [Bacilli bacterium]
MKLFIPKMYQKDIFSINYQKLKNKYKLIIFDLDNTIGSIKEDICNKETTDFLNNLTEYFIVIVASNSYKERVLNFTKNLKCDVFYLSLKPTLHVLRKIKKKYQIPYKDMVIIGDQIMTDIFVGNRKKLLTILVDPIRNIDFKITSINRYLEKIINKKNKIVKGEYYE